MKEVGAWSVIFFVIMSVSAYHFYVVAKKRKVRALLNARVQLAHQEFGRIHFGDSRLRAQLASDVREILSQHVPVPLDGLHPHDKFQEQLLIDTFDSMASIEFISDLEEKYGISFRNEPSLGRDLTFRELIDLIEKRVTELQPGDK
ncbi:MAG: acyl carrier protein [Nitrospira sp.]|nr:acyl carrier protein [Nitrospira sp.]